jgi:two-component system cell cycle sensor histidine kinase/response regulator CckA
MAHEFNNVLTGVSSFATHLLRRAGDDETRRAATHNLHALRRGKSITEEILRYTRPAEPLLTTVDVCAWLESYLPEAMAVTGGRTTLEMDDALHVRGDVGQLNQVLSNLVLNARDASPSSEPIAISARRVMEQGVPTVELTVADRGTGIPSEIRDRIFEPLFTTKRSGTGLGLAVVHQVVRGHGGTVRVRSEIGKGTTFHILLPLVDAPPKREAEPLAKLSILLADDNEAFALGTTELLELEGIRTRVVDRGGDILPAIVNEIPDALILDVGLPDVNGTDVYQTIAARWPRLPVIFVSGHYRATHVDRLLVQPHVAFLEKPFEVARLLEALERVVAAAA